jgi:hypothetical protein
LHRPVESAAQRRHFERNSTPLVEQLLPALGLAVVGVLDLDPGGLSLHLSIGTDLVFGDDAFQIECTALLVKCRLGALLWLAIAELGPFTGISAVIYAACMVVLFDFWRRVFKNPYHYPGVVFTPIIRRKPVCEAFPCLLQRCVSISVFAVPIRG